jgi:hypothetical protein
VSGPQRVPAELLARRYPQPVPRPALLLQAPPLPRVPRLPEAVSYVR